MSNNLYCTTDKLSDIICDNYSLLQVMSRFGLPLGFADNTVEEWCEANQVHGETFLAVVNFVAHPKEASTDLAGISVPALMDYLKQSHHYFLDFQLPNIRHKLIEAIDCSAENEVAYLILKYFDSFVNEVRKHMDYEDMDVFQYVNSLLEGHKNPDYSISMFAHSLFSPFLKFSPILLASAKWCISRHFAFPLVEVVVRRKRGCLVHRD